MLHDRSLMHRAPETVSCRGVRNPIEGISTFSLPNVFPKPFPYTSRPDSQLRHYPVRFHPILFSTSGSDCLQFDQTLASFTHTHSSSSPIDVLYQAWYLSTTQCSVWQLTDAPRTVARTIGLCITTPIPIPQILNRRYMILEVTGSQRMLQYVTRKVKDPDATDRHHETFYLVQFPPSQRNLLERNINQFSRNPANIRNNNNLWHC